MVAAVLVPLALLGILVYALGGQGFSSERAELRMRSLSGSNAAVVLAVIGLGQLILALAQDMERFGALFGDHGPLLASLSAVLIIALVVSRRAVALLAWIGAGAAIGSVFLQSGVAIGTGFTIMVVLMLVFLGFVRGLLPGR